LNALYTVIEGKEKKGDVNSFIFAYMNRSARVIYTPKNPIIDPINVNPVVAR
jgi:hypothetical protein